MELIEGYDILEKIGEGGFSTVFKVRPSKQPNQVLAAKKFNDYKDHSVFEQEVKNLKQVLGLPNTQQFVQAIGSQDTLVILTQYIEGETLKNRVKKQGPYSDKEAIEIVQQVSAMLSGLEARGLRHLDIKPSNILVQDSECVLMDFGVAQFIDAEPDERIKTDFSYAAPEKYWAKHTPSTDIYSLGVTLYYLITGVLPFSPKGATDAYKMLSHCSKAVEYPDSISENLKILLECMLEKDETKRINIDDLTIYLSELISSGLNTKGNRQVPKKKIKPPTDLDLFKAAALLGIPYAQYKYALLIEDRRPDIAKAWYLKSAEKGFTRAQNNLAILLDDEGNEREALSWYLKSAQAGNAHAQYNLAKLIEGNDELSKSQPNLAAHWYKCAARRGHSRAQNKVALELEAKKLFDSALELYRKAAYGGYRVAQYNLARLYENAASQAPRPTVALENAKFWYSKAAEQEYRKAIQKLAVLEKEST